ncbi:nuclear transport factor 2 family protein [Halomonas sp. ISL-60]|uniref:nuclear transport factor 2 family protein n=1 Tax=unclassified Halomonas TaxID=2609666 RepID=UPI001BEC189D|nr:MULTISPECIES: nuclear transport factor 2 family protein [unclassified Halomonas]MBT2772536.1 nuclear transport factor 2 family protein [Halomonas sp. ISL-60]MBT2785858.1 nuclear transport factor 2 family protein [Halomonas sp. ISL-106]MBT2798912.1 nuclear transport factor 2 family protein [Halomonas sp. ISL-104]MBT2800340.1 nuclear transport factor 2 family protein [Halomonas sp. ISL-56]
MAEPAALEAFCAFFNKLDNTCTEKLYEVYTEDVVFSDPLHKIEGREALERYFLSMYENVKQCQFSYHTRQLQNNQAFVTWTMVFVHPKLAGGRTIEVEGCSALTFSEDGRVMRHRDYFDAGAMLYEHLPLMGSVIRWLKKRLA